MSESKQEIDRILKIKFMDTLKDQDGFSAQEKALEILGLPDAKDKLAINQAFKKIAIKIHPDKNRDNQKQADDAFKELIAAKEWLEKSPKITEEQTYDDFSENDFDTMETMSDAYKKIIDDFLKDLFKEILNPKNIQAAWNKLNEEAKQKHQKNQITEHETKKKTAFNFNHKKLAEQILPAYKLVFLTLEESAKPLSGNIKISNKSSINDIFSSPFKSWADSIKRTKKINQDKAESEYSWTKKIRESTGIAHKYPTLPKDFIPTPIPVYDTTEKAWEQMLKNKDNTIIVCVAIPEKQNIDNSEISENQIVWAYDYHSSTETSTKEGSLWGSEEGTTTFEIPTFKENSELNPAIKKNDAPSDEKTTPLPVATEGQSAAPKPIAPHTDPKPDEPPTLKAEQKQAQKIPDELLQELETLLRAGYKGSSTYINGAEKQLEAFIKENNIANREIAKICDKIDEENEARKKAEAQTLKLTTGTHDQKNHEPKAQDKDGTAKSGENQSSQITTDISLKPTDPPVALEAKTPASQNPKLDDAERTNTDRSQAAHNLGFWRNAPQAESIFKFAWRAALIEGVAIGGTVLAGGFQVNIVGGFTTGHLALIIAAMTILAALSSVLWAAGKNCCETEPAYQPVPTR